MTGEQSRADGGGAIVCVEPSATMNNAKSGRKWRLVATGIAVRLVGLGLVVLGDGHDSVWSKALVILGVGMSVGGIAILRYLLLQPLFSKLEAKVKSGRTSP